MVHSIQTCLTGALDRASGGLRYENGNPAQVRPQRNMWNARQEALFCSMDGKMVTNAGPQTEASRVEVVFQPEH